MDLSVIIVNYNVKYFLEQCLISVYQALEGISSEVYVVDNASNDESVQMVRQRFPDTILIENTKNVGFAKANNQAIARSKAKFVLLLNPDTVVESDTFKKCIHFLDNNLEVGALGVRMIDGSGSFLAESKRGFPSPWAAFCKFLGLSSLFPKSKLFNKYHLGYLPEDKIAEVEVLSGAFMMLSKTALDRAGLLDEDFFMYGEDIDLSIRIKKAGFKVVYYPDTSIIHYKGESTKKASINYVKVFYNAMVIFAEKHFSGSRRKWYLFFLKMAIYLRALVSIVGRMIGYVFHPALDFILIFGGLWLLKDLWATYYFGQPSYYDYASIEINFIVYSLIWITSLFYGGAYDKYFSVKNIFKAFFVGTVLILLVYSLFGTEYRSSRALIILGSVVAFAASLITRWVLHFIRYRNLKIGQQKEKNTVIVGSEDESKRTLNLLSKSKAKIKFQGFIHMGDQNPFENALGSFDQLAHIVTIKNIDQVIFCSKDLSIQVIMDEMTTIGKKIEFKMVPGDSMSIIGSNSKKLRGELYTLDLNFNLSKLNFRRNKRLFDFVVTFILLTLSPILIWIQDNKAGFLVNLLYSFFGSRTLVGYNSEDPKLSKLPPLKKAVLEIGDTAEGGKDSIESIHKANLIYAKNYKVIKDFDYIWAGISKLGFRRNNNINAKR